MAGDIFGFKNTGAAGVFSSEYGKLTFSGGEIALIQNWSVGYQQGVTPIYECGSSKVYWQKQHQAGTLQIGRIVSSSNLIERFSADSCQPKNMTITASSGLCKNGSVQTAAMKITLSGVILTGVTYSGSAGQAYISEGVTAMFASLSK